MRTRHRTSVWTGKKVATDSKNISTSIPPGSYQIGHARKISLTIFLRANVKRWPSVQLHETDTNHIFCKYISNFSGSTPAWIGWCCKPEHKALPFIRFPSLITFRLTGSGTISYGSVVVFFEPISKQQLCRRAQRRRIIQKSDFTWQSVYRDNSREGCAWQRLIMVV